MNQNIADILANFKAIHAENEKLAAHIAATAPKPEKRRMVPRFPAQPTLKIGLSLCIGDRQYIGA